MAAKFKPSLDDPFIQEHLYEIDWNDSSHLCTGTLYKKMDFCNNCPLYEYACLISYINNPHLHLLVDQVHKKHPELFI